MPPIYRMTYGPETTRIAARAAYCAVNVLRSWPVPDLRACMSHGPSCADGWSHLGREDALFQLTELALFADASGVTVPPLSVLTDPGLGELTPTEQRLFVAVAKAAARAVGTKPIRQRVL